MPTSPLKPPVNTMIEDDVVSVVDDPAQLDALQWNALLDSQASASPFMCHAYLLALHRSGSAVGATGWMPQFLLVQRDGVLIGACPLYVKDHSYGEYVFDWAWADAYQRHGLSYYPKLLVAVPFTPVPGPRLLAQDLPTRRLLLRALQSLTRQAQLSSAHLLFIDEADAQAARDEGWLLRSTVQFHWCNSTPAPYADFNEFLASMQREKRKKINQERRRVIDAGVTFTAQEGVDIAADDWGFFYRCYAQTYLEHRSTPYLTQAFFAEVADTMPANWLLFVAWQGGQRIAASLIGIDPVRKTAFGRYWGALVHVPCLHFEACYYQPLAWCIAHGYQRFEGGAQGEHKMARGLMPVPTASAHWLAHAQFSQAVSEFLKQEGAGVASYLSELNERGPFKAQVPY
jgi:uncharacterized protein